MAVIVLGVVSVILFLLVLLFMVGGAGINRELVKLREDASDVLEALDAGYAPTDARLAFAVRRLQRSVKAGKR